MHFRRPLIPCILAYMLGLWLTHDIYHTAPNLALLFASILTFAALAIAALRRDLTPIFLLLIAILGATVMGVRERQARTAADTLKLLDTPGMKIISGTVRATSDIADTERSRILLSSVRITSGSQSLTLPGKLQFTAKPKAFTTGELPAVGEKIAFPGRVKPPFALQNFFGYNRLEALRHQAIYATAIPMSVAGAIRPVTTPDSASLWSRIDSHLTAFRKTIGRHLSASMWQRESRLMNAMLFNDLRSLNELERRIFRDSGTFHLFAVSGMHVAILGFLLHLIFRALRLGPRASWVAVAIVLFIYLWVIGFVPSATRSYLMLVAFTAAYMLGREVDTISALVFAIAVVVAVDPAAPWNAGFILSVAGVTAIVLFTPLMRLWFTREQTDHRPDAWHTLTDRALDAAFATAAVTVIMYPIQVYYFGFYNVLSPLANLIQACFASAVLAGGIVAATAALLSETVGQVIGGSASLIMAVVYHISRLAADFDLAIFYFHQMPLWLMLLCYALLFSGYYLVHRDTPEFRLKSRARFATHVFCGLGFLAVFNVYSNLRRDQLEIYAFDVGQGDATLIRFPDGRSMLIDAGVPEPDMGQLVAVPQLRGLGIHMIDYIVATHDDIDHTGGLASVIKATGAHNLLIPDNLQAKSSSTKDLLDTAKKHNCIIQELTNSYKATAGECTIEILNPPQTPTVTSEPSSILTKPIGPISPISSPGPIIPVPPETLTTTSPAAALPIGPISPPSPIRPIPPETLTTTSPAAALPIGPISPISSAVPPDNDQSLVIRLTYGNFTALLMADATKAVESRLLNENSLRPVTLLKVGHHGSSTGTTAEFLDATKPQLAIISCGANNRYGHPHKDLLHRLTHTSTQTYRTDHQGAIKITTDGKTVKIRTARN